MKNYLKNNFNHVIKHAIPEKSLASEGQPREEEPIASLSLIG